MALSSASRLEFPSATLNTGMEFLVHKLIWLVHISLLPSSSSFLPSFSLLSIFPPFLLLPSFPSFLPSFLLPPPPLNWPIKEWQLRMVGIETGEPDTEEMDVDGEEDIFTRRRPMGAINPLLVAQGKCTKCYVATFTKGHSSMLEKGLCTRLELRYTRLTLPNFGHLPHLNTHIHTHAHTHAHTRMDTHGHEHAHKHTHTHQNPIQDMMFPDATDTPLTDKTTKSQTIP